MKPPPDPAPRWSRTALYLLPIGLIAFGFALRVQSAHGALFFGDEWHTLNVSFGGFGEILRTFDRFGTGVAMPLLVRAVRETLAGCELGIRSPALAGGVLTVLLTWWYGRRLMDPAVGVIAALLVALSSISIFYSAFARSYTLVCVATLLLGLALGRMVQRDERPGGPLVVVGLTTALLPFLHLTALSSALSLGGAGVLVLLLERRRALAAKLALALALGVGLGVLLHVPAWDGVTDFVGRKSVQKYTGAFSFLDVAAVLTGNRTATVVGLVLLVPVAAAFVVAQRARSLPVLAAIVGPAVAVAAVRPFGDAYAYARYAIAAVPFLALLFAWALRGLAGRLTTSGRAAESATVLAGTGLAIVLFLFGSLGIRRTPDGAFAASYISLYPLPDFDRPYDGGSVVYDAIASDDEAARVLELPHLIHRGILMYRSYSLRHGKDVRTGFLYRDPAEVPDGYPTLADPGWAEGLEADYVVLHVDAVAEAERYWDFLYAEGAGGMDPAVEAYMQRHEQVARNEERPDQRVVNAITRALGEPFHRDEDVVAWRR